MTSKKQKIITLKKSELFKTDKQLTLDEQAHRKPASQSQNDILLDEVVLKGKNKRLEENHDQEAKLAEAAKQTKTCSSIDVLKSILYQVEAQKDKFDQLIERQRGGYECIVAGFKSFNGKKKPYLIWQPSLRSYADLTVKNKEEFEKISNQHKNKTDVICYNQLCLTADQTQLLVDLLLKNQYHEEQTTPGAQESAKQIQQEVIVIKDEFDDKLSSFDCDVLDVGKNYHYIIDLSLNEEIQEKEKIFTQVQQQKEKAILAVAEQQPNEVIMIEENNQAANSNQNIEKEKAILAVAEQQPKDVSMNAFDSSANTNIIDEKYYGKNVEFNQQPAAIQILSNPQSKQLNVVALQENSIEKQQIESQIIDEVWQKHIDLLQEYDQWLLFNNYHQSQQPISYEKIQNQNQDKVQNPKTKKKNIKKYQKQKECRNELQKMKKQFAENQKQSQSNIDK